MRRHPDCSRAGDQGAHLNPPSPRDTAARRGEQAILLPGSHPRYAPTGHLIYLLEDDLMAVPFDAERLRVDGTPVSLVQDIATANTTLVPTAEYGISRDGSLLVAMGAGFAGRELVWVGRDGSEQKLPAPPRGYTYPRVSPDGRQIALNQRDANGGGIDLWDVAREDSTPVTGGPGLKLYPVWAPDGQSLVYGAGVPLEHHLYRKAVERGASGQPIDTGLEAELRALYFVSSSGDELVFARQGGDGAELMIVSLTAPGEPKLLLHRGATQICRRTGGISRINPTNPGSSRFTCARFRTSGDTSRRCRPRAAFSRSGHHAAMRSFISSRGRNRGL